MKNLILILMFILPSVGFSQRDGSKVMDVNNIDYRLLDSLIIVEVNKVRDSLGNYNMNYSRIVSDNISKQRCQKLLTEQHVYHPEGRELLYTDKLESSIMKESSSTYKFKGSVDVVDGFEICLFKRKTYKLVTYSDIALSIVDLFETSPDHCYVVREAYDKQITETGKEIFLMSGVSTKYGLYNGKYGFYTVLNLTVVYKY
jgi:hypothetical protein